jgi:hypothetical protein
VPELVPAAVAEAPAALILALAALFNAFNLSVTLNLQGFLLVGVGVFAVVLATTAM